MKDRVPPQFLSKSTGNIVIDDVIADIIKNKSADDDFLRKVVLVLLGTVIAPMSSKIEPKQYYSLVDDVKRISNINWNAFTLRVLFDYLRVVKKGKHLRQWPKGNLGLLQYLYWEKVQPLEGDCAFNPNVSLQPLMRNWTKVSATRRDRLSMTMVVGMVTSRCIDYIHMHMRQILDQVAEKLLEKLNKEGVMYMLAAAMPSYNNDENPWIIGNSPRSSSSYIDIMPSYVTKFMANSKGQKFPTFGKDDEVLSGKRKRIVPKKFESTYALDKRDRHYARGSRPSGTTSASRALFSHNVAPEVVADELTLKLIDAVVTFMEIACRSEKNKGKEFTTMEV
ncbi:hypothetical protein D1007_48474 [Hordeum vulgare]|nr:hypothetical protein D1007_48474 [Hordeum vulgare]